MFKSTALADRVADMLAAIYTAAKALFRHTSKAISVREKANRTTASTAQVGAAWWPLWLDT